MFPAFFGMGIGERIKTARKQCGLSQVELAKAVGRSQSAVAEWETGDTEPRRNIVEKIATALGVSALWLEIGGVGESSSGERYEAPLPASEGAVGAAPDLVPVYAAAPSEHHAECFIRGGIVEHRLRPNRWKNVKGLYGFFVADDAMAPRLNVGELVWVHPHRRAAPGQETVFISCDGDTPRAMLRVLVGQTQTKWIVRRLNPKKESDLKKAEWDCQLVVGIDWNR